MNQKLALFGGPKTITKPLTRYNSIGAEEMEAAQDVLKSGNLSQFLGCWEPDFYGGPKVREFEKAAQDFFQVKNAVTVNSLTSGLVAAIGAIGVEPGDEVIVSPWTMSATATAILHWNALPVFADIEPDTFCLDPKSVEKNITPQTKAIVAVDIFGQSANMQALQTIAKKHGLRLISDTAQAPGALYGDKYAGTLSDIGGFSLNYHKHIHTGEGGIMVTNDDNLAERMQLIRNHAEAVVGDKGVTNLSNMLGHNFRLGEIEAAIGIQQLKKLSQKVASRRKVAQRLTDGLKGLKGLKTPTIRQDCTHVYYYYPMILDISALGVPRSRIFDALAAEGVTDLTSGYANLHLQPLYQKKIAYGTKGFPWTAPFCRREINYEKGICPVAEKLHSETFLGFEVCVRDLPTEDTDQIVSAFHKIWDQMEALR